MATTASAENVAAIDYYLGPVQSDAKVGTLAMILFPISLMFTLAGILTWSGFSVFPPLLLVAFCVVYLRLRTRMTDLVLVEGIVMVLYTLTPHFGKPGVDPLTRAYGLDDANVLHNIAISGYFIAVRVTSLIFPMRQPDLQTISPSNQVATQVAASVGALASIALSAMYVQRFGFVFGGDLDYSETFELLQTEQAGLGVLLLAIPLAFASLALALANRLKMRSIGAMLPLFSFVVLLIVQGQRKYLIIPLMFIGVSKLRVRRTSSILIALVGIAIGWTAFCYLGYLRIEHYPISRGLDREVVGEFVDNSDDYLAGETMLLAGTGSAAVQGAVQPLPYFGDYTLSWLSVLPRFIYQPSYETINVRFAYAWSTRSAKMGMGWGFDFWGEAYVVGGPLMVMFIAFCITSLFRFLYVKSSQHLGTGFWGAYAIIGVYYALWFQRNGVVYLYREYFVFAAVTLGALVLPTTLLVARQRRRKLLPLRLTGRLPLS